MGIGTSIFLMAVGAVLTFALETDSTNGVNLDTVGIILMIVGAIGVLLSLLFWSSWGGVGARRTTVIDDRGPVVRRRVYDNDIR